MANANKSNMQDMINAAMEQFRQSLLQALVSNEQVPQGVERRTGERRSIPDRRVVAERRAAEQQAQLQFQPMDDAVFMERLNMRRNNTLPERMNTELDAEIQRRKAIGEEAVQQLTAPAPSRVPAAKVAKPDRKERNGVKAPAPGGVIESHWALFDKMRSDKVELSVAEVKKLAKRRKLKDTALVQEFYRWKKYNGIK